VAASQKIFSALRAKKRLQKIFLRASCEKETSKKFSPRFARKRDFKKFSPRFARKKKRGWGSLEVLVIVFGDWLGPRGLASATKRMKEPPVAQNNGKNASRILNFEKL